MKLRAALRASHTPSLDAPTRAHRVRRALVRGSLALFGVVCVLAAAGAVYQAIMTEVDRRAPFGGSDPTRGSTRLMATQ
jgi:hypothetical protein